MEAMSFKIPVLAPVKNSNLPVLVDKENFDSLFATNFSPRNYIGTLKEDEELLKIKRLISNYFTKLKNVKINKKIKANPNWRIRTATTSMFSILVLIIDR